MANPQGIDNLVARNSTKVNIVVNGSPVGRVQTFQETVANNVQVLNELGSAFAVELRKGITTFSFSISKFYCRADVFDSIKYGQIFSLEVTDRGSADDFSTNAAEVLELFRYCSITSLSRDYTIGQATVGLNATVVTIGQPTNASGQGI